MRPHGNGVVLEMRDVSKRYGDYTAVRGLSLEVRQGEFFFLLGPSGSGKSTTLRLIAGLERPDAGGICLGGRVVNDLPPDRRRTALVFQNYALFPHKTVFDNVAFGPRMKGWPRPVIRERVRHYLDMVQLWDLRGRLPGQLSGGQQQRVALARALIVEPSVLLLDEPLSNLDLRLRHHMRSELRRLQRSLGITAVYVTHDQSEALSMADRIAILHEGRLIQVGTPSEVYESPSDPFVASFLGDTNFLTATVAGEEPEHYLLAVEGLGAVLRAPKTRRLPAGRTVTVSIRPERLRLRPGAGGDGAGGSPPPGGDGGAGQGEFLCRGRIEDVYYQGATVRYQVRADGDLVLKVDTVNGPGAASLGVGLGVAVFVSGGGLAVLPEREGVAR